MLQFRFLAYAVFLAAAAVALDLPVSAAAEAPANALGAALASAKATDIKPQDVINWQGFQAVEKPDQTLEASLRLTAVGAGWKIYAKNLKFSGPPGFAVTQVAPPPAQRFLDPIANEEVDVYAGGEFTVTLSGAPRWTGATLPVTVTYVGCTNSICLFPYSQVLDIAMVPLAGAALAAPPLSPAPTAKLEEAAASSDDLETRLAKQLGAGGVSYGLLLVIVFAGGLLSNLTPCVAPMVPITLRLLARQGGNPYRNAGVYALGIVVCYSALGLAAALSGGMFGSLLASKAFNIAFALVMIALGLSMLGFGDLSQLQALGSRMGSGKPSAANTFLMGVGAGLVAAPCTGPILAALLAYTARSGSSVAASTGLLSVYSAGFALPYVLLGGAASQVTNIKVPPLVQLSVKLLFASVMLALGFYYLRIPFYDLAQTLAPHWHNIALAALAAGVLISPLVLLSSRLQNNKLVTLVPALCLGLGLFASWQWATGSSPETGAQGEHLSWYKSEGEAFAAAKSSGKPILIDMWAEWCEACKKMDHTTMQDPEVQQELRQHWVLLRLDLTESNATNDQIQQRYNVPSLPTLTLLPPHADLAKQQQVNGFVNAQTLLAALRPFAKS